MEDILAITFIFGGGTLVLLSFSPLGKAFAERIRHGKQPLPAPEIDPGAGPHPSPVSPPSPPRCRGCR